MAARRRQDANVNGGRARHGDTRPGHQQARNARGKTLRAALYSWAFHKTNRETEKLSEPQGKALLWLQDHSLAVAALDDSQRRSELIRRALNALSLTMEGNPAAAAHSFVPGGGMTIFALES